MSISGPKEQKLDQGRRKYRKLLKPGDLPDNFTRALYKIAPYRGCGHGCRYCDGRAERYFVEGDFEADIQIRETIPECLERELPLVREPGIIAFGSGVTDPYQPLEKQHEISGRCARLLAESPRALPAMVMTKSVLPIRDLPSWKIVNARAGFILLVSINSIDESLRAQMEPGAPSFAARLDLLRLFKSAGCVTGVLAMPLLPLLSDSSDAIGRLFAACKEVGVDFIMPGGLTLRPGRQKQCYIDTVAACYPSCLEHTKAIYSEERPSGSPSQKAQAVLFNTVSRIQKDLGIPHLLPYSHYAPMIPQYDALRILFRDMIDLYRERNVDIQPLKRSADRYDRWLIELRRFYRRTRTLPSSWLLERFETALVQGELRSVLDNPRLMSFVTSIIREGAQFNYISLRLES